MYIVTIVKATEQEFTMRIWQIQSTIEQGTKVLLTIVEFNAFNKYLKINNIKFGYNTICIDNGIVISKRY